MNKEKKMQMRMEEELGGLRRWYKLYRRDMSANARFDFKAHFNRIASVLGFDDKKFEECEE